MKSTSLARVAATATVLSVLLLSALPKAQAQTETVLYNFCSVDNCNDGGAPNGPLTVGWNGNFYGTTNSSGANDEGAVFGLYPEPAGGCETGSNAGNGWCEFVLYSFCSVANCADGALPLGNVAFLNGSIRRPGNLYGTTLVGGGNPPCTDSSGCGTVFEIFPEPLSPPGCPSGTNGGNGWCEAVLYKFCSLADCADGTNPVGNLVEDSAGNLYGTVANGVFELSPNGSGGWTEALIYQDSIYQFNGNVQGGLAIDSAGNLYGVDADHTGVGNAFKLSFSNENGWTPEILHTFTGEPDGAFANGPPALDSAGNVYGTTYLGGGRNNGTVWKLELVTKGKDAGTYKEKLLHQFTNSKTGIFPSGGVMLDSSGNIYGTAEYGGSKECILDCGIVFELAASGTTYKYQLLWTFNQTDGLGGEFPSSSPILGSSGNLYGVTRGGGSEGSGTVYELTP